MILLNLKKILRYSKLINTTTIEINKVLKEVNAWSVNHRLQLNAKKSLVINIGTVYMINKKQYNFNTIHINNIEIPQQETARNLGVFLLFIQT